MNPTTLIVDGIILGNLNATSATGQTLKYSLVSTSDGGKLDLGTVPGSLEIGGAQSYTILPYATWLDGTAKGTQTFTVRVSETTAFDTFITGIPLVGTLASPIISLLQQTPLLSSLLAPIIGGSIDAVITVPVAGLAPGDTPVAYTYKVASFDGTLISTNFFPASGLASGATAYTVLNGPGLGGAGSTNPYATNSTSGTTPGLSVLRGAGYNAITWDPRGEWASGGILQLDNPFYEGRDVSALISWAAANTPAVLNSEGDPAVGMVGGSYGGGIQMSTIDPRIEAIVPAIAWNSLNESLYPSDTFKTAWANTLALSLLTSGARVNSEIYPALIGGDLFGGLSETAQALLASSGPTALLNNLQAPTLLVQGIVDALFPLQESIENAETILGPEYGGINPFGVPVKMIWFCGGHGICFDPVNQTTQAQTIFAANIVWLNAYVKGQPLPVDLLIPDFQWWDQAGIRWTSALYPFEAGFNQATPLTVSNAGGTLGILPFAIGGSGPNTENCAISAGCSFPLNQVFATEAANAINVPITGLAAGQQIVGAPTVSFTYSGLGTSQAVFAQIVDNTTGRVLGNIVSPIDVVLDGQEHTVSAPIANIAYTAGSAPSLTLQIVPSATLYWNSSLGLINVSDIEVALPLRAIPVV